METEVVPDYKALGTFRIDKILLESEYLENKESSDFDFGIISKAIYVMNEQIKKQQSIMEEQLAEYDDSLQITMNLKDQVEELNGYIK